MSALTKDQLDELEALRSATLDAVAADLMTDDVGLEGSASSSADRVYTLALKQAAPALIQAAREQWILEAPIDEVLAEAGLTEADTDAAYERLMRDVATLERVMMERDAAVAEAAEAAGENERLRDALQRLFTAGHGIECKCGLKCPNTWAREAALALLEPKPASAEQPKPKPAEIVAAPPRLSEADVLGVAPHWNCERCGYMNAGPVCTHCGSVRGGST